MLKISFLLLTLFLSAFNVFAGDSIFRIRLKPAGFVPDSRMLEGMIGNEDVAEYKQPFSGIEAPAGLFVAEGLDYRKLLVSGMKSLLLEYKNYQGQPGLSAYSLFAAGNYSKITPGILRMANKYFFGNSKLLLSVYKWAMPYYRETFSMLTIEEQMVQKKNLLMAEKYTEMVLARKNIGAFKLWLKKEHIKEDKKLTGFLARRINKRQWTVEDCRFWISKIKADFLPLIKDPGKASAHYQITDTLENNLYIVVNHIGQFALVNKSFEPATKHYALMLHKKNNVFAFRSDREGDYRVYNLDDYATKGVFPDFPLEEWISASAITDSSYLFYARTHAGIYDYRNKKIILDSVARIIEIRNSPLLVAAMEHGEPYYFYDRQGKRIGNEAVGVDSLFNFSEDGSIYETFRYSIEIFYSGRLMILRNGNSKYGAMDSTGKIVVPFKYDYIVADEQTSQIRASRYNSEIEKDEEEIYYFSPTSP